MRDINMEPEEPGLNLEKIMNDIDDITDPSCMDKLMEYVEDIQAEDEEFIELLTMKFQDAKVYWDQPSYQLSLNLSTPYTKNKPMENLYRKGPMSSEEHELIVKNWRKFIKKYHLPDKIISLARWKNRLSYNHRKTPQETARRYTVSFLARGLERTSYQVFFHITQAFGGYRTGHYSAMEKKIIEICDIHKPKQATLLLSVLLGRRVRGLYSKLDRITNDIKQDKKFKWTLPRASKLVNCLLQQMQVPFKELKNQNIEPYVWRALEEDMGQSYQYLRYFWYYYLHVQLFVNDDVKLYKLRKTLFKKIKSKAGNSSYRVWSDIRWKDLVQGFPDGFTREFLYKICHGVVRTMKGYSKLPLIELVDKALHKIKNKRQKIKNKRIRKLRLRDDGQLEVVHYNTN